ncbi:hypothetical protein MSAN_01278400 [Mycena sanguinolenta]|uniref:Uncharacterized protein n=1 Tax=Mycena sanguinolenta TaxID=230812 RepID=A0A8H6YJE2_9AGAR|nr:hypothetical protein MSAN_01278400 [Mycena sanguinolenta]
MGAQVLYFDGMSAAWGPGWLDSQHMFIYGMSKNESKDINWWDDYGRANRLCEWGKTRDVEGFVRMNAGFEIIWCDFHSPSLQLVSHLNITPPGTPDKPSSWPSFPGRRLSVLLGVDLVVVIRRGEVLAGEEVGPGELQFRISLSLPHLTLFYCDMVTFYHPRLTSLVRDRIGLPMESHRLVNISSQDAQRVVSEVDDVLSRRATGDLGSGFDWGTTTVGIVEYWGDRISHMHAYLLNASDPRVNLTATLPAIRTLAYTLVNPYMQPGLTPNASGWDLFFAPPTDLIPITFATNTNVTAFERCTSQATGFLSETQMTPQERLLRISVESVLSRLCNDFGVIFAQSSDLAESRSWDADPRLSIQQWTKRIQDLMEWLDWTVWLRCEEVCPLDVQQFPSLSFPSADDLPQHVCSVPMWPIAWAGPWDPNSSSLEPRCMRMAV